MVRFVCLNCGFSSQKLGKYRLRTPKVVDKEKAYPVELEYTWNRQIIRKTTNVFVKVADWNQNGNQGRGEIRASHGGESKRLNQLLLARVERIDSLLAEYNEKHPNQITADVVSGFLADREGLRGVYIGTSFFRLCKKQNRKEPV